MCRPGTRPHGCLNKLANHKESAVISECVVNEEILGMSFSVGIFLCVILAAALPYCVYQVVRERRRKQRLAGRQRRQRGRVARWSFISGFYRQRGMKRLSYSTDDHQKR